MGVGKGYHLVSPVLTVHPVFNGFFLYVYILINHWHQTLFSYAFARKYGNHLIEIFSVSFCRDTEEVDAVSNMLSVTVRNMLFTCTVKKPHRINCYRVNFSVFLAIFFTVHVNLTFTDIMLLTASTSSVSLQISIDQVYCDLATLFNTLQFLNSREIIIIVYFVSFHHT